MTICYDNNPKISSTFSNPKRKDNAREDIENALISSSMPERINEISARLETNCTTITSQSFSSIEFELERLYTQRLPLIAERNILLNKWWPFRPLQRKRLQLIDEQIDAIEYEIDNILRKDTNEIETLRQFIIETRKSIEKCNSELE